MAQLKMLYGMKGEDDWEKFARIVKPVIANSVRKLCIRGYRGHPRGCPNFRKRDTCPPRAPLLAKVFDLDRDVYAVWNRFDLAAHVQRMYEKHSEWSMYQVRNCLYWQGTARKQLRGRIAELVKHLPFKPTVLTCPEACGVNVTATMREIGIGLEWPPVNWAYQVALAGYPLVLPQEEEVG